VVSFTPQPLYPQGKNPWYPLDRRLGGPQSRSGCGGEEKDSQPPSEMEHLDMVIYRNTGKHFLLGIYFDVRVAIFKIISTIN
jgi:hypothetical protein